MHQTDSAYFLRWLKEKKSDPFSFKLHNLKGKKHGLLFNNPFSAQ